MAISQTTPLQAHVRVFRLAPNGRDLSAIPHAIWQQIINHERPLQPANGSVKVLLLQLYIEPDGEQRLYEQRVCTQLVCKQIDALRLQTDEFGFLLTWDATAVQADKAVADNAVADRTVATRLVDARHLFLQRFIAHRHSWHPHPTLVTKAIVLATGESTTTTPL